MDDQADLAALDLEALIMAAAPALEQACSSFGACAVLWSYVRRREDGGNRGCLQPEQ